MELAEVVLFLHITVALAAFSIATVIHTGEWGSRRVTTVAELRTWAGVIRRFGQLFPIMIGLLLVLGAWLVSLSDGKFDWGDGWVASAVVALVVLGAIGGAVLDPAAKRLVARLAAAPDRPVTPELRAAACNPVTWALGHLSTGLALGVVFTMTTKPSAGDALAVLVVGSGLGAVIGYLGARSGTTRVAATSSA